MGVLAGSGSVLSSPADTSDSPPSIVEDYTYPGAVGILAQDNVKLFSGDGGILFADCASPQRVTSG